MAMSSDDIIHHMACDFSQYIAYFVPKWEFPDEPADAYTDTIIAAFGDAPTESSVIDAYKSGTAASAVKNRLNSGWETNLITDKVATQLVERAIINNFGRDALK